MPNSQEGSIKFQCEWIKSGRLIVGGLGEIIKWRQIFYYGHLIGVAQDGTSFGNLSMRTDESDQFVITGSQTSGIKEVDGQHFTKIISVDIDNNFVRCVGPVTASSETLTHSAFYKASPEIQAVVHIHNREAWEKLIKLLPHTGTETRYGTPAMAKEIIDLYSRKGAPKSGIFIMAGHQDGIIAFGSTLKEASEIIIKYVAPHLKSMIR